MLTDKQIEREKVFCYDWYVTRKMDKTPTYADAIVWADNYWQKKFNRHDLTSYGRLYSIWINIKSRCNNKNNAGYYRYGKRGISICEEWNKSFINFAIWSIFNGYEDDLSIDRIDVNGNYEPSNCKWSTKIEQGNNRRNNRWITYNGKQYTISEFARLFNVEPNNVFADFRRGLTEEQIINKYKNKTNRKYGKHEI